MIEHAIRTAADLDTLTFDERGLVTVVAQDASDGSVLMVAWADRRALELTLETGFVHYWSRSRRSLWKKGETSGNVQRLVSLHADCDGDTVLVRVDPAGPACHTGERTCFGGAPGEVMGELWETLRARARDRPEGSYTVRLLDDENLRLKKLGEEQAELVAALARGGENASEEAADLLYHLLVALAGAGEDWATVLAELRARRRG